ncbi:MAG: hypothetical protein HOE30_24325 [Deltaproteobacteria bacterium]|nr:hypothetical protein [Deltaproteobacteria bacterium]
MVWHHQHLVIVYLEIVQARESLSITNFHIHDILCRVDSHVNFRWNTLALHLSHIVDDDSTHASNRPEKPLAAKQL